MEHTGSLGSSGPLEAVQTKIADASGRMETKRRLTLKLDEARKALESERQRLAALHNVLAKEESDLKGLEGLSLAGLFYEVLGRKDEAIDRERQEYLRAKLRYDQAKSSVEVLESDVASLTKKVEALGDPEADLMEALRAKERILLDGNDPTAEELLEIQAEYGRLASETKEIQEAVEAGNRVLTSLDKVANCLGSAQGWGMWDLLGGGLIATAVKHSRLDEAKEYVNRAQQDLNRFKRELVDVSDVSLGLEMGGFERFADYFFDGLLVDWIVQSKINQSLERTKEQMLQVQRTVDMLRARLGSVKSRMEFLKNRREGLLSNI